MSDKEQFDWDDDMDFESLADEHAMEDSSFEDLSEFSDKTDINPPEIETEMAAESDSENKSPATSRGTGLGLSAGGLGVLFAISTLVSGLGLAGAVLFVGKLDPLSLWNPEGLIQVDQWFNFQKYPLNMLYILVAGVVVLGFLGSWAVARSVRNAQRRHQVAAGLLEQITALRLDSEEPWQNPDFKTNPQVASFVAETLGFWRLQMASLKKYSGQEGELRRFQKALDAKSRDEMVGRFDNPYVGTLADSVVQLFDEGQVARNEARSVCDKDQNQSQEILGIVQDARSWNRSVREKIGSQGVTVEKLTSRLTELGSLVEQLAGSQNQSQAAAAVADITREVAALGNESGQSEGLTKINELVDHCSKLAFQVAMEVARLGNRGERLLPMTQALEELATEFRKAAEALAEGKGDEVQSQIKSRLDQVHARLLQESGPGAGQVTQITDQLIPAIKSVQGNMAEVVQSFNQQGDRLTKLGESLSQFTGVAFNADDSLAGNPDNPPEGGLNLTEHDPFGSGLEPSEPMTDVDPFSHSEDLFPNSDSQPEDSGFLTSVTPGQEESYSEPEPVLPPQEEKVYDLVEFGAIRVDEPSAADSEDDKVYDLAEFGAVSLT